MKRTAMLTLGVIALGLAPSNTAAQDAVSDTVCTVNTGSVFFLGNDLGDQGATLWIVNDSLRITTPQSTYAPGYAVGMRQKQEWDMSDRTPAKPDTFDTRRLAYAESHRGIGLTQRQFIERMAEFYRSQPDVELVIIPHDNAVEVKYKQLRGPVVLTHQVKPTPHTPPSPEQVALERLNRQQRILRECADALASCGVVVIGDGNFSYTIPGQWGANLAAAFREELARGDAFDIERLSSKTGIPSWSWVLHSFMPGNRRALPGLR